MPQEQKEEDKKMSLLLTDPQSQVFGDEEESDRCMQPLPSQITLKMIIKLPDLVTNYSRTLKRQYKHFLIKTHEFR